MKQWLQVNYCEDFLIGIEWGYKHIKAEVMAEEFLEEDGGVPVDYKFYCFSGRVWSL